MGRKNSAASHLCRWCLHEPQKCYGLKLAPLSLCSCDQLGTKGVQTPRRRADWDLRLVSCILARECSHMKSLTLSICPNVSGSCLFSNVALVINVDCMSSDQNREGAILVRAINHSSSAMEEESSDTMTRKNGATLQSLPYMRRRNARSRYWCQCINDRETSHVV